MKRNAIYLLCRKIISNEQKNYKCRYFQLKEFSPKSINRIPWLHEDFNTKLKFRAFYFSLAKNFLKKFT